MVLAKKDVQLDGVAERVRTILMDEDVLRRAQQLAELLREVGPSSVDDVRAGFETVVIDIGNLELVLLAEWWASFDPQAAFEWMRLGFSSKHPAVITALFRAWGRTDPQAALEVINDAPFPDLRRAFYNSLVAGWDESGQPGVMEFLQALGPGEARQSSLMVIARRRAAREGAEGVIGWAESVSDEDSKFKLNAHRRAAGAAGEVDPRGATAWVEEQLRGEYGSSLPRFLGTRWAAKEPVAALEWLSGLPAGTERDSAVRETYRVWATDNAKEAMAWMRESPAEPWLDRAWAQFAQQIARRHPEEAVERANAMSDAGLQEATLIRVGRIWLLNDEAAARAWMQEQSDVVVKGIEAMPASQREGGVERAKAQEPSD
jgi:hypothetical protein